MQSLVKNCLVALLSSIMILTPLASVQAGVISSAELLNQSSETQTLSQAHQQVLAQFERAEVQEKLLDMGASPEQIKERVQHLTVAEAEQLNQQIDDLPAGGLVGALVLVFIVFVITDAVGATDVFTFVDPVR